MGKKEELLERLLNLDDSKLERLLDSVENPTEEKPKKRTQNRKSQKEVDKGGSPHRISGGKQSRGAKRKPSNKIKGRRDKGAASIPQSLDLDGDRPNEFLEMGLNKKFKADTKLQKKLSGDYEFSERRPPIKLVEATCSRCEFLYGDVHPSEVVKDGREFYFVCDDCQRSKE